MAGSSLILFGVVEMIGVGFEARLGCISKANATVGDAELQVQDPITPYGRISMEKCSAGYMPTVPLAPHPGAPSWKISTHLFLAYRDLHQSPNVPNFFRT